MDATQVEAEKRRIYCESLQQEITYHLKEAEGPFMPATRARHRAIAEALKQALTTFQLMFIGE